MANGKEGSQRNNKYSERLISDQSKDPDIEEKTIHTRKKRNEKKENSKFDISENNDQRLNEDEFADEKLMV